MKTKTIPRRGRAALRFRQGRLARWPGRRGDRLRALADELGEGSHCDGPAQQSKPSQLEPPLGEIDLLLNNAGLRRPWRAYPTPTGTGSKRIMRTPSISWAGRA